MNALREIQQNFQSHLFADNPEISKYITGKNQAMVTERMDIYINNYFGSMFDSLSADYEVLKNFMGEDSFTKLGDDYIQANPSHYIAIDLIGQNLAKFLKNTKPYNEKPYLSELADFLWQLNSTVDAADAPILTMEEIKAIPQDEWADMCLSLHPSVFLINAEWNILPIWQALIQKQTPPPVEKNPTQLTVWRKELQSYYAVLSVQEATVLKALKEGRSFGEICEDLVQWLPEDQVAPYAVNLLIRWLNEKMLSAVTVK